MLLNSKHKHILQINGIINTYRSDPVPLRFVPYLISHFVVFQRLDFMTLGKLWAPCTLQLPIKIFILTLLIFF